MTPFWSVGESQNLGTVSSGVEGWPNLWQRGSNIPFCGWEELHLPECPSLDGTGLELPGGKLEGGLKGRWEAEPFDRRRSQWQIQNYVMAWVFSAVLYFRSSPSSWLISC